jgi:2,3-bisphosphoglycerate-dependent phosphoglycerate mutase
MQLSLIIFRTGTVSAKENIFLGWLNLPLSKEGLTQAEKVSAKLSNAKIDIAFCSDQLRSKQALAKVLSKHTSAKVVIDHRLRERNYGIFSGHEKELFKKYFSIYNEIHRGYEAKIPKGENLKDVSKRIFPFMRELIHLMQKEKVNVAICAHTNSMRAIEEYLESISVEKIVEIESSPIEYKKYVLKFDVAN